MEKTKNLEKLFNLISRILEIDTSIINSKTSPDNTETWDSYNGLMMVSELESVFNVHFTMDEVVGVRNVGDIIKALKKHGVDLQLNNSHLKDQGIR